jgi:L-ascorbate metabolism protein UlaG (beta-lactamase superfamily)
MTAIPASDGLGDPQLSWLVRAGGISVLHLGDTVFHGWWWRIAQRLGPFDLVLAPVNGAVVDFPHRQPPSGLPVVMTPEQAAIAAEILGARLAAPMHASGYDVPGAYEPVADAARSFADHAARRGVRVTLPALGEPFALRPATAAPEGRPSAA